MAIVKLTHRAMSDLLEIREYSIQAFGNKTADQYIIDIENALLLLQEHPELIKSKQNFSESFYFYRVRSHTLVCSRISDVVIILTIKHSQVDLIERLDNLEPLLMKEAKILYNKLKE